MARASMQTQRQHASSSTHASVWSGCPTADLQHHCTKQGQSPQGSTLGFNADEQVGSQAREARTFGSRPLMRTFTMTRSSVAACSAAAAGETVRGPTSSVSSRPCIDAAASHHGGNPLGDALGCIGAGREGGRTRSAAGAVLLRHRHRNRRQRGQTAFSSQKC